ncbi:deacetylase SIR2 [Aerococcus loyolae]|uniref:SIR2 family NAD-dependent protein deacylase n=1 Tax=Aerococcus TaxID=1375 RepID=UPI0008A2D832|nr:MULTISPECIES: deacetylase SIR2 [Aerococcus]MDK7910172.1 deacetylase SIR2 [Aerococcus urinae]MDK8610660.1 deacetylase SIR2 [Aerococcus urinae]MDL5182740.1 deacetylase SIR2 [Aerococcus loyolae]OFL15795.1 deacetylase SIR2 [Aerococcus loyolae]PKY87015.1 deacetylase SIR2 [Aerococcus loyolae]
MSDKETVWQALSQNYNNESDLLRSLMEEAQAILVGIGAGMSAADGFSYVGERFEQAFPDFIEKFNLFDMLQASLYDYPSLEEYWAFASRFAIMNGIEQKPGKAYQHFNHYLQGKNYFIITTNADNAFPKAGYDMDKVHYYQGKYVLMQCKKHCQPVTYRDDALLYRMAKEQENMRIPSELVPYCPNCGAPLELNKRTAENGMVEDKDWQLHQAAYEEFVNQNQYDKILYLEIGVGNTTPQFIRQPFQAWTKENPKALYVMMNQKPYHIPPSIKDQSLRLTDDIQQTLCGL